MWLWHHSVFGFVYLCRSQLSIDSCQGNLMFWHDRLTGNREVDCERGSAETRAMTTKKSEACLKRETREHAVWRDANCVEAWLCVDCSTSNGRTGRATDGAMKTERSASRMSEGRFSRGVTPPSLAEARRRLAHAHHARQHEHGPFRVVRARGRARNRMVLASLSTALCLPNCSLYMRWHIIGQFFN